MTERLDEVQLAPGFSYAEQFAGTNGIGTSLSSGRATLVYGREHYSQDLGQFACAGAPIKHPTRGKIIGLLDLTAWSNARGAMLTALASSTAKQIEQELLAQTGMRELALFSEYMKTCQQSNGPVLALNNDVVMTNELLRQLLDVRRSGGPGRLRDRHHAGPGARDHADGGAAERALRTSAVHPGPV